MAKKLKTPKVAWAVDALYSKVSIEKRNLEIVNAWNGNANLPVEPVFVLNDIHEESSSWHSSAASNLKRITEKNTIKNLLPVRIVRNVSPPFTIRKLVDSLIQYCKKENVVLLVLHSSNKNLGERLLLGSFAETFILSSTVPVLLINAKAKKVRIIKTILFATDFSKESLSAYRKVLSKAKSLNAKIIVCHQMEKKLEVAKEIIDWKVRYYVDPKKIKRWQKLATEKKVKVKILTLEGRGNKSETVITTAIKNNADLISLVSISGPVSSILLGSMTRQIARNSNIPVWILHPSSTTRRN